MSPRRQQQKPAGMTRRQLAEAIGVDAMTVTRWSQDGMPVLRRTGRGRATLYDLDAVLQWRAERDAATRQKVVSLTDERARLARAQAEKVERENLEAVGRLADVEQVRAMGAHFVKGWVAILRALPRQARRAGIISTVEQERQLAALIRRTLEEISRWDVPPAFVPRPRRKRRT